MKGNDISNLRAVAYVRVSTEEQAKKGMSLVSQECDIKKYCSDNDIELVRVFCDEGKSARTSNRPEFLEMLKFVIDKAERIDRILVWRFDRFARNQAEYHAHRVSLRKAGVELVSITQLVPEGSTGALVEGILASIDEYEALVIGERSKRGLQQARRSGKLTHKAPVGLRNRTYGKGINSVKVTEHDTERVPFVQQIFEMACSELYLNKEIVEHVNTLGFTMPGSGNPLTKQTLNRILSNRVYTGYIFVNEEEGFQRAEFPPIISKELFEKVQWIRDCRQGNKKRTKRKLHPGFPLRQFIKCPSCGKKMTGSPSTSAKAAYPNYHVPKHKEGYNCPTTSISKFLVESDFILLLKRLRPTPGFKKVFKEAVAEVWREKQGTTLKAVAVVQKEADRIRARLKKLHNMWYDSDPDLERAEFRSERKRLQQELEEANSELRILQDRIVDLDALLDYALEVLEDASRMWLNADVEQRWMIQRTLFPEGLSYSQEEGFGNPVSSKAFNIFPLLTATESHVLPPTGFELQ